VAPGEMPGRRAPIPGATIRPSKVAVADFVCDSHREHRHEQCDATGTEHRQDGGEAEAHGGVQQPAAPGDLQMLWATFGTSPHCLDGVPAKAIARVTSKSDVMTAC
jgi:hypothetical protein